MTVTATVGFDKLHYMPTALLQPGDVFLQPTMGTVLRTYDNGTVDALNGFGPCEGYVWTVLECDGVTLKARHEGDGSEHEGRIPQGNHKLRVQA